MAISGISPKSNVTTTIRNRNYKHAFNVFTSLILLQLSIILSFIAYQIILHKSFAIINVEIQIGISLLFFNFFKNIITLNWDSFSKNIIKIYSNILLEFSN